MTRLLGMAVSSAFPAHAVPTQNRQCGSVYTSEIGGDAHWRLCDCTECVYIHTKNNNSQQRRPSALCASMCTVANGATHVWSIYGKDVQIYKHTLFHFNNKKILRKLKNSSTNIQFLLLIAFLQTTQELENSWWWWWVVIGSHLGSLQLRVCLCFVEDCGAVMNAYLKRKSMTHIWSFHLFLPKPERLKCLSVSRCPPPQCLHTHTQTQTQARAQANTQIHTNQPTPFDPLLSSFCSPSIFLNCHCIVNTLLKIVSHTHTGAHTEL